MTAVVEGAGLAPRLEIQRVPAAYEQVAAHLRAKILAGVLADGARLPSVRGLAHELGISTATAREALRQLRHEGLALGIPGVATVVRAPRTTPEVEEVAR